MDVDARLQLFDLKTRYQFQTSPGIANYNMPLYNIQTEPGAQTIASFPVYQGFMPSCYVNGIEVPFYTERSSFYSIWPNYIQPNTQAGTGDGTANYTLSLPFFPAIPGYVDIAGIIATGANQDPILSTTINTSIPSTSIYAAVFVTAVDGSGITRVVQDSGQFFENTSGATYGMLMAPGTAPFGYKALNGGYSTSLNTVNYATGAMNVTFTDPTTGNAVNIPSGNAIQVQCYFYQQGIPRALLFNNNCITVRPPPNISYLVELTAYLTPAAFLSTGQALPYGYMAEYIARGAARKILADTGDIEQFQFYEPLFKEQESLVWKRSQRQFTATRTSTIFNSFGQQSNINNVGQGAG